MGYQAAYDRSLSDPDAFCADAARLIDWDRPWERVLDASRPPFYRWFSSASLNTCWNAVDRHVAAGRGDQAAIIHDSPVTDAKVVISYRDLKDRVARFAGALRDQGVEKGDRVIIYMPMVPEAAIAMLACARIGAIHSVVFGGFSSRELATRIDDAKPKVMVAGSCGIEPNRVVHYKSLLDQAIALANHQVGRCIVLQRPQEPGTLIPPAGTSADRKRCPGQARPTASPSRPPTPSTSSIPSGTTGQPKGVVRDNGSHALAMAWSMANVYGVQRGEVFWAASDVGWVVGHSYIVYGPLLAGCTTVLYEGKPVGTPDAGAFWRVIEEHGVSVLFTAPTAFRAIKRADPEAHHLERYEIGSLRALFLAGERCDPDTLAWAERILGVPVIDHWWQTETGWAIAANCLGIERLPVKPGSPTKAVPGYRIEVLGDRGEPVSPGDIGRILLRLPLPPGCLPTLWGNEERFYQSYLAAQPGY